MNDKSSQKLIRGSFYHVYNRSNNREKLFYSDENYRYFMRKFNEYLKDFIDLYAYCLLPNHFHFLVKVLKEEKTFQNPSGSISVKPISRAFADYFNSYTKSINKQENRNGNLFNRPFKRNKIEDRALLKIVVNYIHRNPIHHNFANRPDNYRWSSYTDIMEGNSTYIKVDKVLNLFGGIDNFIARQNLNLDLSGL